ncbi:MAG: hypothetical protein ABL984_18610 [Pyrinomonadaceae bacterium]
MSRSKNRYLFLLSSIILLGGVVSAQTPAAIEKELVGYLDTMSKSGTYGGEYDDAKLTAASDGLKKKLVRYAGRADVLKYSFPKLKETMFIATSKDGKFRIYSWDLESGGTMHDYDRVIQFTGADGKVKAWFDGEGEYDGGGAFYTDVFQVASTGGPIYLLASTSRASSSLTGAALRAMRIVGNGLDTKAKVIKTGSGITNDVYFAYDFFSVVDRPERPIRLFTFNEVRKEFKFPIVIEDDETPQGRVTNKFITYRFNGTHFVKVS